MKLQLGSLFVFVSSVVIVNCQNCYYPNGDPAKSNDIPCSLSLGSACCPQGWQCLDNGLCYLDNQKYFGRYTCTDHSWKSSGCPQICTHSNTASGNEAILQCSKGNYCCDANRPDVGCCDTGVTQFPLKDGNVVSSGSNSGSGSGLGSGSGGSGTGGSGTGGSGSGGSNSQSASGSGSSSPPSSSSSSAPPSSSSSSSTPTSSSSSSQSSLNSVAATTRNNVGGSTSSSSGGAGTSSSSQSSSSASVSIITSVVTSISGSNTVTSSTTTAVPVSQSQTPSQSSSSKNLGAIIGPAVGAPVAVIALAALAFFLWRRRRNNRRSMPPPMDDTKPMGYGKPEPESVQATPDMARYSGNTLTQSPRFSQFGGSPELAGNYPQHYDPSRPQAGELPGSMYHPYNPNLPRELPA